MILYAKIIDSSSMKCTVGIGSNEEFYKSIGMEKMDVEQSYDGDWYLVGYAPAKPEELIKEERIAELKTQLTTIDEKSNRSMRAILTGTATDDDRAFLANLETQAANLRLQIRELEEEEE